MRSNLKLVSDNDCHQKRPVRKPNEKFDLADISAALEASGGIISAAARMLRCDRSTIRRYVARYPEVAAALENVENEVLDIAEAHLIRMLTDDSNPAVQLNAVMFYLRTKGKSRGYSLRSEASEDTETHQAVPTAPTALDLSRLSTEEINILNALLVKAIVPLTHTKL